jgi:hypothetical protein
LLIGLVFGIFGVVALLLADNVPKSATLPSREGKDWHLETLLASRPHYDPRESRKPTKSTEQNYR